MKIIDGKAIAAKIRAELKEKIAESGKEIGLAVVIAGEDPASQIYVRNKVKACEEVGIVSKVRALDADCGQAALEEEIERLAKDDSVHGILLQLPLPKGYDTEAALKKIPVSKDVDGFSAENLGLLAKNGRASAVACTPLGVMKLLERENIEICGKRAVVIGRSETVGKPMALLLLNADATVTVCHSKTKELGKICAEADILVTAIGKAKFVTADMVKEGAVVVDIGINRDENGKLCGDVDFEEVSKKASFITPVPGGVGPMTIAMLLYNTVEAALKE